MTTTSSAPGTDTETVLAELLAGVVGVATVLPDSHFFDDLGADSMLMARFCARVRKRDDLPPVSIKDVYSHPTVRSLAAALDEAAADEAALGEAVPNEPRPVEAPPVEATSSGTARYALCGALQALVFLVATYLGTLVAVRGYEWISAGTGVAEVYLRTALFAAATLVGFAALPILAKWTLIGRFEAERIPLWSLAYFRFWVVKTLIRANPMVLFAGTPLYVLYLQALGAHIGRDVTILSKAVPVCPDLLTIGAGTVIRKDSTFQCFRAEAGFIRTGPVTLGADAVVSENTVLDIDTAMGDGAQLGHSSALHSGQSVPAGESWHGSPAIRSESEFRTVEGVGFGRHRKAFYVSMSLLSLLLVRMPLAVGVLSLAQALFPEFEVPIEGTGDLSQPGFYAEALAGSLLYFFGGLVLGLAVVTTVPRLLARSLETDRVYPLYGFHYGVHRTISRLTNSRLLLAIFGDSSYVVGYLRAVGYHLTPVVQTGSNFGSAVKHEHPYLTTIGSGTMVADGLSIMNAEYSATSFRVSPVKIGARSFLGNVIAYPPQAKVGENCLLGTKVMIPIDGKTRENVGLLGSPCFEIPRTVARDRRFDDLATGEEFDRRLSAKNRHNLGSMALFLAIRWAQFFFVLLIAMVGSQFYGRFGAAALAASSVAIVLFSATSSVLFERAATWVRPLQPVYCSIYERAFWRHERFWKTVADPRVSAFLNGTPFKAMWWRLAGARIGRRLFDDGSNMTERALVTIGDDCVLNAGSVIQCHSQEDGTFKADRSTLGAGCTLGVRAHVHYATTMGDGAALEADSFLMKGEEVPPGARWGGNPARDMTRVGVAS